ncbi:MAG TPA: hypothetical protein VNT81_17870, partial [Vicinamibacterales bacterium]|nr:hypothetical protein [Vicinamibacterales bacterium]
TSYPPFGNCPRDRINSKGEFDAEGNPTLKIQVSADENSKGVSLTAIIDTGFSGFVLLPIQYSLSLGLAPKSTTAMKLADDHLCIGILANAYVRLDDANGRQGVVTLERNCNEVLIGMDFLRQFGLALSIFTKQILLLQEATLIKMLEKETADTAKPAAIPTGFTPK